MDAPERRVHHRCCPESGPHSRQVGKEERSGCWLNSGTRKAAGLGVTRYTDHQEPEFRVKSLTEVKAVKAEWREWKCWGRRGDWESSIPTSKACKSSPRQQNGAQAASRCDRTCSSWCGLYYPQQTLPSRHTTPPAPPPGPRSSPKACAAVVPSTCNVLSSDQHLWLRALQLSLQGRPPRGRWLWLCLLMESQHPFSGPLHHANHDGAMTSTCLRQTPERSFLLTSVTRHRCPLCWGFFLMRSVFVLALSTFIKRCHVTPNSTYCHSMLLSPLGITLRVHTQLRPSSKAKIATFL